jgi:hypothetical protein
MIKRIISILILSLIPFFNNSQSIFLPTDLNEISGLEILNDSLLIAHNDGGNSNEIYLLNFSGKIIKKIRIANASNIDWEDITSDQEYLFIGDIGNNHNKRKDLKIYRIKKLDLISENSIIAESMNFSYADQQEFPPVDSLKNFDAECLIAAYGDLWIFTKNRTIPFNGICKVYRFHFESNTSPKISIYSKITIGDNSWKFDSVTAGDFAKNKFYLSTYNRWLCYELKEDEFTRVRKSNYSEYNQKEALVINENLNYLFVANEYNKLLGKAKLKRIKL